MSNFVDVLSPKALAELQKANTELVTMIANVKTVNQNMVGANTPSGSDSALKALTAEYQKQEKVIQSLQKQLQKLAEAKSKTNARTSEEIVNQRALATAADRQTRSTSALVGAYANLSAKHAMAKKTLQDLIASQTASNAQLRNAQREFDALDKRVMAADRSVRVFNRNVGNYPQINQLAGGLRSLMSAFGLFTGVFLFAQVIKNAFEVTKQFDKATADLAATMGGTRKDIEALTTSAKQFGATTIFTATEVTKLQKELGKLGFSQREILASTKGILALASAVDTDLATAAEVGGSTLRAFNLDASEMERVVDVMAKSFTSSALDISNFRESIKYVAPVAAASNVTLEQTTALLGVLADNGIKGSMAGTSLRRIMTDIVRTGKPFNEGLREIVKNGISVKDAFDEVGRTAQTSLVVLGNNIEKIDALTTSLDNAAGAAQRMADEQLNSLQGKIMLLTSAWDGFILSLNSGGSNLSNFLIGAIELMTEFVKAWEYAFANSKERNTITLNTVIDKKNLELENDLLNNRNKILKEQELISKRISILEKQIKVDPNNQGLITELNLLRDKKQVTEEQLDLNRKFVQERAQQKVELYTKAALESSGKALEIEKKIFALRQQRDNATNIRAKDVIDLEITKLSEEFRKLNNETKIYNGLILTAGKYTEKLKKDLIAVNEDSGLSKKEEKELERLKKLREKANEEELQRKFELNKLRLESDKRYFDKSASDESKYLDARLDATNDAIKKQIEIAELNRDEGLRRAKGNRTQELIIWEQFYKEFETIIIDSEARILKLRVDTYKEWEDMVNKFEGEGLRLNLFGDDPAKAFEDFQKGNKVVIENYNEDWEKSFNDWSNVAIDAINVVATAQRIATENRLADLQREKEVSLLFAGESATARAEIERQYEEKRRRIQNRQAKQEKAFAISNIIINTARGVVAALTSTPPNVPLSIAIGAIGLAQSAVVASQQIPQFYKGTENAPEGWAWTQEKGAEIITDKHGKVKTTGSNSGAELTYLKKGDKVLNAEKSKSIIFNKELNSILNNNGILPPTIVNNSGLSKSDFDSGIKDLAQTIKNKTESQTIIDKGGFRIYQKQQGKRAELIGNRLRIKA